MTAPGDLPRLFAERWNRGDAAGIAALFAEDADFVNVVGLWWRRRRDIEKAHAYALARYFKHARLTVEQVETRRIRPDVAVVHGRWTMQGQIGPDGAPGGRRHGIMLLVAEMRDDEWTVVAAQNTDIAPGSETLSAEGGELRAVSYER